MKKRLITLILLVLMIVSCVLPVSAEEYSGSFTYSYGGEYQYSPAAFTMSRTIHNVKLAEDFVPEEGQILQGDTQEYLAMKDPYDLVTDSKGNVYIADTGNHRIIITDKTYQVVRIISGYESEGQLLHLNNPKGLFVDEDDNLYIVDTGNRNVARFFEDGSFDCVIAPPSSTVFPEDFEYIPTGIAVDKYGRIYVVCDGTNEGIISFDQDGEFEGFLGASKVTIDPLEKFWRLMMTEQQLAQLKDSVPNSYNNITVDGEGFIYVTCSSIDAYTLKQIVDDRTTSSPYMPIKKLNPAGTDVLKRTGFFAPVGEIQFNAYSSTKGGNPSAITEITVLDNDVYSVVDSENNLIFTYDEYGNLLYGFGETGTTDGTFQLLQAIAYQGKGTLLALDRKRNAITVFEKTKYGLLIDEVIEVQQNREFSKTIELWKEIIKINNNYDLAYLGIGKALLSEGNYGEAMDYFKAINNRTYYNKAFEKQRSQFLEQAAILIPVVIVLAIVAISKFFGFAKRYNLKHRFRKEGQVKRSILEEFMYGFHIIFHPFDGFWDLKHEKRGGMRGAFIWLALAVLAMATQEFLSSYLISDPMTTRDIFSVVLTLAIPLILWCVVNWCLTALTDGEGSGKDIFLYTSYAIVPFVLLVLPASLASNFLTSSEMAFVNYAVTAAYVWSIGLIFIGCMVTHDYSLGKNVWTCVLTLLGMLIVIFLALLLVYVFGRTISFVYNIITEISFRF